MTLDEVRRQNALRTRKGIGMPLAGLLYWVAFVRAVSGVMLLLSNRAMARLSSPA